MGFRDQSYAVINIPQECLKIDFTVNDPDADVKILQSNVSKKKEIVVLRKVTFVSNSQWKQCSKFSESFFEINEGIRRECDLHKLDEFLIESLSKKYGRKWTCLVGKTPFHITTKTRHYIVVKVGSNVIFLFHQRNFLTSLFKWA